MLITGMKLSTTSSTGDASSAEALQAAGGGDATNGREAEERGRDVSAWQSQTLASIGGIFQWMPSVDGSLTPGQVRDALNENQGISSKEISFLQRISGAFSWDRGLCTNLALLVH